MEIVTLYRQSARSTQMEWMLAPAGTWAGQARPVPQTHGKRKVEAELVLPPPAAPVTRRPDPDMAPVQQGSWQKRAEKSGMDSVYIPHWEGNTSDRWMENVSHGFSLFITVAKGSPCLMWGDNKCNCFLCWLESAKYSACSLFFTTLSTIQAALTLYEIVFYIIEVKKRRICFRFPIILTNH